MKKIVPVLGLILCASAAYAQTDLGVAGGFNAFIFGNATTVNGGESEGAIAIGGNWTAGTYNVNINNYLASVGSTNSIGAYIGGNVNVTGSANIKHGNADVKGSVTGSFLFDGGGSLNTGSSYVNSSAFNQAAYQAQSNYLASLSDKAINTSDPNNLSIDLSTATKYGHFKVFSIAASDLTANRTLSIANFTSADTLLINITGGDVSHFGLQVTGGNYDRILWNDSTAASFTIDNRLLEGSLLAPLAAITQNNVIEGNLIAASWNSSNGNELHFGAGKQFDGALLSNPVPEPGSVALFTGMVVTGMGLLARRKRATRR